MRVSVSKLSDDTSYRGIYRFQNCFDGAKYKALTQLAANSDEETCVRKIEAAANNQFKQSVTRPLHPSSPINDIEINNNNTRRELTTTADSQKQSTLNYFTNSILFLCCQSARVSVYPGKFKSEWVCVCLCELWGNPDPNLFCVVVGCHNSLLLRCLLLQLFAILLRSVAEFSHFDKRQRLTSVSQLFLLFLLLYYLK